MKCCFGGRSTSPEWSEDEFASNSGRLVLSELGRWNIRRKVCRVNWILKLASMAGNRTSLAINLMTPAGLVEGHSLLRSV